MTATTSALTHPVNTAFVYLPRRLAESTLPTIRAALPLALTALDASAAPVTWDVGYDPEPDSPAMVWMPRSHARHEDEVNHALTGIVAVLDAQAAAQPAPLSPAEHDAAVLLDAMDGRR